MPRGPRLDVPGVVQHVIVRGIERRPIFIDDRDRGAFVTRLSALLADTGTDLLAWALIPNHFHLLLRPNQVRLAAVMRRLLTGHAVTFNLRHNRSGHLVQNRYKSIVCDEEVYLKELVRYIHLNPLRARIVSTLTELEHYPWCGHGVLLGRHPLEGQAVDEVLHRFAPRAPEARRRYQEFVETGVGQGRRDDLVGGGMRRSLSAKGEETDRKNREAFDDRVLGLGSFVESLWRQEERPLRPRGHLELEELIGRVGEHYGIDETRLRRRGKDSPLVEARGVVCYLAVQELGLRTTEVGQALALGQSGVSRAVARGASCVAKEPNLRALLRDH